MRTLRGLSILGLVLAIGCGEDSRPAPMAKPAAPQAGASARAESGAADAREAKLESLYEPKPERNPGGVVSTITAATSDSPANESAVKGAVRPGYVGAAPASLARAGDPLGPEAPASRRDIQFAVETSKAPQGGKDKDGDGVRDAEGEARFNTEAYAAVPENDFLRAKENPLSTFSIDVDTASYANVRRFLTGYHRPPPGAVRLEELVNYFSYDYAPPTDDVPFAVHCETAQCPWNTKHHLLRIALKGKIIEKEQRPVSNLVFLIDVSGSMNEPNKLPLVKESLKLLVGELSENDRIAICVYAGAAGLVLPSTTGDNKQVILSALDNLQAGGSTNGGAGISQAYATAVQNFIKGGTNRVILCTDGDFNVGQTSHDQLLKLIEEKAKSGVFLSVLGFGHGNYKDTTMELLADKGNGNYAYIDTLNEGRKVFVEQMTGTLITIAKDVKIQVDFNPAYVAAYRLLGYENRMLKAEDFKDDKKDAGEIGAGHTVTALYELVPPGQDIPAGSVDPSKYQKKSAASEAAEAEKPSEHADELLTVRLRYKEPDADVSKPLEVPVKADVQEFDKTSVDFQFATSVVQFGMLLRNSKYKGDANWDSVLEIAQGSLGADKNGYRAEFVDLAKKAREVMKKAD